VLELHLVAGKDGARSRNVLLANFSLHSLARWFQRSGNASEDALIHAMNLVANIDLTALGEGGGVKITTDPDGGGWRGRVMVVEDCDGNRHRAVGVRTSP
jgi:hypothetical protein